MNLSYNQEQSAIRSAIYHAIQMSSVVQTPNGRVTALLNSTFVERVLVESIHRELASRGMFSSQDFWHSVKCLGTFDIHSGKCDMCYAVDLSRKGLPHDPLRHGDETRP
jgi:hypothetical protein